MNTNRASISPRMSDADLDLEACARDVAQQVGDRTARCRRGPASSLVRSVDPPPWARTASQPRVASREEGVAVLGENAPSSPCVGGCGERATARPRERIRLGHPPPQRGRSTVRPTEPCVREAHRHTCDPLAALASAHETPLPTPASEDTSVSLRCHSVSSRCRRPFASGLPGGGLCR